MTGSVGPQEIDPAEYAEVTLRSSSGADVLLTDTGCGLAANVFWAVGTSATIGTGTDFVRTILADQSITGVTSATVNGRLLAR